MHFNEDDVDDKHHESNRFQVQTYSHENSSRLIKSSSLKDENFLPENLQEFAESKIAEDGGALHPSYFHYKRWIWVIFPWASMCVKDGLPFSFLISRCFETATRYMSTEEEFQLSKDTLTTAAAFKRRINVLLYQSEQKTKMKKLKSLKDKQQEDQSEDEKTHKDRSFFKKKPSNPLELHKIVRELHQKRQERIANFNLNSEGLSEAANTSNNQNTTSRKDLTEPGLKSSRISGHSPGVQTSRYFLKQHMKTDSARLVSEPMAAHNRTASIGHLNPPLPLLKLESHRQAEDGGRRQSTTSRIRGWQDGRDPRATGHQSASRFEGVKGDIQQHLDASMKRLSAARVKVNC
jgi:hypothetical protein